jgi:hypothetical protein
MCMYWFIFFKMQTRLYVLLPLNLPEWGEFNDYYPFEVLLGLCFTGQVMSHNLC